ncbi:hypothetical protein F4821DRAFT_265928 [Hypoxylon rubiginosum]|uniref:Uncharacterized protein n=1 Tax=Hypoxylon rubiginosum TaxID=110542 RepID=A0ACC0CJ60_9PEZI|nr:hypothetical protein F4821DRAFT_265928 [Hypoxylon rubiginosum]
MAGVPGFVVKMMVLSICIIFLASKAMGSPAGFPVGHPVGHTHTAGHNCSTHHNITVVSNVANVTSGVSRPAIGFVGQEKNVTTPRPTNDTDADEPQNGGNAWSCKRCWTSASSSVSAEIQRAIITFFICLIMIKIFM